MSDAILEFQDATLEGGHRRDTAIWGADFRLEPGELMIVHLERGHARIPLADAAEGLLLPIRGRVLFMNQEWQARRPAEMFAARRNIGRVFDEPGWLTELNVDDNVVLAQRHHTKRSEQEILDEASELARHFGLPGLPQRASHQLRDSDLRRAACARAFMGEPSLLILENPTAGVYPDIMPPLMDQIRTVRTRGAAVLWTTGDWEVWNNPGVRPTYRATITASQLHLSSGS